MSARRAYSGRVVMIGPKFLSVFQTMRFEREQMVRIACSCQGRRLEGPRDGRKDFLRPRTKLRKRVFSAGVHWFSSGSQSERTKSDGFAHSLPQNMKRVNKSRRKRLRLMFRWPDNLLVRMQNLSPRPRRVWKECGSLSWIRLWNKRLDGREK